MIEVRLETMEELEENLKAQEIILAYEAIQKNKENL